MCGPYITWSVIFPAFYIYFLATCGLIVKPIFRFLLQKNLFLVMIFCISEDWIGYGVVTNISQISVI